MSAPAPSPAVDRTTQLRFGLIIFGAALLANFHLFTVGWENTLLGYHEFRQVQTAISTYYFVRDGVTLNYVTPLFGPPWQFPLEFPLFQATVAAFVRLTGFALDPSGRLVSWLYFMSALPAAYLLLGRFRLGPGVRLQFLALLLLSPLYIFFSRLFMIESTAMAAGVWFLLAYCRVVEDRRPGWLAVAWLAGGIAGTVKMTTWIVFLVAAGLLCLVRWWRDPRLTTRETRLVLAWALAVVVPPMVLGLAWTGHARSVWMGTPELSFMNGLFGYWSFGDLAQRLSWSFWYRTSRVWIDEIAGESGLILLVVYFALRRGLYLWPAAGCVAVFLSGQLIFANLYWVHDYYFYASGLFLVAAVGFCLADIVEEAARPAWQRWAVVGAVLVLQLSAYDRSLRESQEKNTPVPQLAELVAAVSQPRETIVVLGQDWDAALPYYSGRRALMLLNGRQDDPAAIRASIARLDPGQVAAVVIVGNHWRDTELVNRSMAALNLGNLPLLSDGATAGLWVPEVRQAALRDTLHLRRFDQFHLSPMTSVPASGVTLLTPQISGRREFDCFSPRPVRAFAMHDFTYAEVDSQAVLVAHATTELTFAVPAGATRITAIYGLDDNAYTGANRSDGIELLVARQPLDGGPEEKLYYRWINPRANAADRGVQKLDLALPAGLTGRLVVRVLPGPAGDPSFDWSYIGQLRIL